MWDETFSRTNFHYVNRNGLSNVQRQFLSNHAMTHDRPCTTGLLLNWVFGQHPIVYPLILRFITTRWQWLRNNNRNENCARLAEWSPPRKRIFVPYRSVFFPFSRSVLVNTSRPFGEKERERERVRVRRWEKERNIFIAKFNSKVVKTKLVHEVCCSYNAPVLYVYINT